MRHLGRQDRSLSRRSLTAGAVALCLGVAMLAPAVPASAASSVGFGAGCVLPRPPSSYTDMVAGSAGRRDVIIGDVELARAQEIENGATRTASSVAGVRVRQQIKLADAALTAPLPTMTNLSLGARASTERMLRLRFAAVVAADGTTPAQNGQVDLRAPSQYLDRIEAETKRWGALRSWGSTVPLKTGEDSLLETAEVATAVAFGYSLTRDRMTATERGVVRAALVSKALTPACSGWSRKFWMTQATYNWGVVVNAGMAMAAIVVADGAPAQAAAALAQALPRANRAIRVGSADGGTPEGPSYAGLIGRYTAYLSASAAMAFPDRPALVATVPDAARYLAAVNGPSGQVFDYADSNVGNVVPWLPLWNARNGGDPLGFWLGQQVLDKNNPDTLNLLWTRTPTVTPASQQPTASVFRTSGIATLRSDWSASGTFLGVKAGSNAGTHAQLDLGSFVLDVNGKRFVGDYGADDYGLKGYLNGKERFRYWRNSTAGHSTLQKRSTNQPLSAVAALSGVSTSGASRSVTVNMTKALGARSASRVFTTTGASVTVRDTVKMLAPTSMRWNVQTQAAVKLVRSGRGAVLTIGSQQVEVRLSGSTPGTLRVQKAPTAPSGGLSNAGWSVLSLDFAAAPDRVAQVSFVPR